MRTHNKFRGLEYPRKRARVSEVVALRNLVTVRIEPVLCGAVTGALSADVVFAREGMRTVIPFVDVAGAMLDRRESSPFVWPAWLSACVSADTVAQIERAILPWVEAQTFNRSLNSEVVRHFGTGDGRAAFELAREHGFIGAAPYRVWLQMAAPYVYAERLARGKRVHAADGQGASGAAILSASAREMRADLASLERNALAREWFDLDIFGECGGSADVDIGGSGGSAVHLDLSSVVGERVLVATPIPTDVNVSFDPEDAPAAGSFAVSAPRRELRTPALPNWSPAGGSGGRILLLVRDDAANAPDADTDAAELLAVRLRAEGFHVDVAAAAHAAPETYDLLHCCCAAYPEQALPAVRRANAARVPVVTTEASQMRDGDATWGTAIVPQVLRATQDETALADLLQLVRARKLEGENAVPGQLPFATYRAAVEELRTLSNAVVPSGSLPLLPAPAPLAPPAGTPHGEFVLVHAPVTPRANQWIAARAAARAGLPLVLAGPVADVDYLRQIRAHAGHGLVTLPEPAPQNAAGLYAAARVYLDVSWLRLGGGRIALAQAAGCPTLASPAVDPADEAALAEALGRAWSSPLPPPAAPVADPLAAVVAAYSNCAAAGRNT